MVRFSLPEGCDEQQVEGLLTGNFAFSAEEPVARRQAIYDTFDWRLFRRSLALYHTELFDERQLTANESLVTIAIRREARELPRRAPMVIEAKFSVPDPAVYWHLQVADRVGGYSLSTLDVQSVWDKYLDTKRRRILAAGYSCRRRDTNEGSVITIKSLGGAEGPVHRRGEWELKMATARRRPAEWPDGPVRDLVLQLIGQESLLSLFELHQTRVIRLLKQDEQPVARLSLDRVSLVTEDGEQVYLDLEVELLPQTPEETLMEIVTCLQDEWHLKPEPLSKGERALALLDAFRLERESESVRRQAGVEES